MQNGFKIVDHIRDTHHLELNELTLLLTETDNDVTCYLKEQACLKAKQVYQERIFIRGLIEFTNYCKNDCYYCGIRCSNQMAERYRLNKETILACCKSGYELGYRTFVLQGGEDVYFTDKRICDMISAIHEQFSDCAITLSIGEKSRESYQQYFDAGANRYLLRHETANASHYRKLHPETLSLKNRKRCLWDLKEIGYQVGCGFMVGSPFQTIETIYEDLKFIMELMPQMVGIGPFIPQKDTPFAGEQAGTLEQTLRLLSIIRLLHPHVLLPATTALGTIHPQGRELGILAGANVVMPNLSPIEVRNKYKLYDNKLCTGEEAAECRACIDERIQNIGYQIVTARGDYE
ncbi:MAG: [FeFe] hydrogenase H-cluster radical SAM maturase HydE [Clostridia bacterium]|nr:[FeFe] hydrogenase H-cluster radical SAM maturase HydE [Clostridia bacterium]